MMTRILCARSAAFQFDFPVDGYVFPGGYVIEVDAATADAIREGADPWPYRPLDFAKTWVIAAINDAAGKSRSKFITVIPGQEMTYAEKEREATAYQQDPAPDPSNYPMLAAEALSTGRAIADVVTEVLALAEQWRALGAQIEGIRRGAIVRVQQATTTAEVDAVTWNFP